MIFYSEKPIFAVIFCISDCFMAITLHIFNPSHDEALASNSPFYTPTRIAQRMERELEDFPRLWAEPGDVIPCDLFSWLAVRRIEPWGWNRRLRFQLRKAGAPEEFLPSDETLEDIRRLSSRKMVSELLPELVASCEGTFGESHFCTSEGEAGRWLSEFGESMVKAPWSCSGRGVFRCAASLGHSVWQRIGRIIEAQGGIEVQPYYKGGHDFAMEFECAGGEARYLGISMFLTSDGGQYLGNIVDSEENLMRMLESRSPDAPRTRYIYNKVCQELTALLCRSVAPFYDGPVGIDMLLVGERIHPMLEMNLRQTMGGVAIRLRGKVKSPSLLSLGVSGGCWKAQLKNYGAANALIRK